jgi:hypothetical protein
MLFQHTLFALTGCQNVTNRTRFPLVSKLSAEGSRYMCVNAPTNRVDRVYLYRKSRKPAGAELKNAPYTTPSTAGLLLAPF